MEPTYFKSEYKSGECTNTVVSCIDKTRETTFQLNLGPKGEFVEAYVQVNHLQNSIGITQAEYTQQHFDILADEERKERHGDMVQVDFETFDYIKGQVIYHLS